MKREQIIHLKRMAIRNHQDTMKVFDALLAKTGEKAPSVAGAIKLLALATKMIGGEPREKRTYTKRAEAVARDSAPRNQNLERHKYAFTYISRMLKRKPGLTAVQLLAALRHHNVSLPKMGIKGSKPAVALTSLMMRSTMGQQLIVAQQDGRFFLKKGIEIPETTRTARPSVKGRWAGLRDKRAIAHEKFREVATEILTKNSGLTAFDILTELKNRNVDFDSIGLHDPKRYPQALGRMMQMSEVGKANFRVKDKRYFVKAASA